MVENHLPNLFYKKMINDHKIINNNSSSGLIKYIKHYFYKIS